MANKTIKRGIRKRIVVSILIVGILPLVVGLYLTYVDGTTTRRNSIGASFQEMAKETANKIDIVIRQEVVDVQRLAISPDIRKNIKNKNYEKNELNNYIRQYIAYDEKKVYSVAIVDDRGNYVSGIQENAQKNYSGERWFKEAFNNGNGKVYVGDLRLDEVSGMYLMGIAAPVMDNKAAIGVVVIKYSMDKLLEVINNVRIENTGHANSGSCC